MHDTSISATKLAAAGGWAIASLFVMAAWLIYGAGDRQLAVMVALTGCPIYVLALVAQIRAYTMRVCGLLRVTRFEGEPAPVRSLR